MKQILLSVVALVCVAEVGVHGLRHFQHTRSSSAIQKQVAAPVTSTSKHSRSYERTTTDRASIDRSALLESLEKDTATHTGTIDSTIKAPKINTTTNNRDPFVPFYSIDRNHELDQTSPLRTIDLSDMRLAAVIRDSTGSYSASIETKQGKNFIVKRGAHIGTRGGQVVEITASRVIISEITQDALGKKSIHFRELAMRVSPPANGLIPR